jgi:uncharacterized protein YbjT (DUF2867 family)
VVALGRESDVERAVVGSDAAVHCAGINREIGAQTYRAVHLEYTARVADAARRAGVRRIAMLSFLRARPDCGSGYHESKWTAEEIVRGSGLDWTILKAGVIYGRGDHMLDHLSQAFHTFPVFGLVGLRSRPVQPVAVDDVARILVAAAVGDPRLARGTFAVLGPDELLLSEAVRRVADVAGRHPLPLAAARRRPARDRLACRSADDGPAHLACPGPDPRRGDRRTAAGCRQPASRPAPGDTVRRGVDPGRAPATGGFGRRDLRWCAR